MSGDRMVTFMADHLRGNYDALEKAPGIFTLKSRKPGQLGAKRSRSGSWSLLTS